MNTDQFTYPEFNADLLLTVENSLLKINVDKVLANKPSGLDLKVEVREIDRQTSYSEGEWISSSSFINLYVSDKFIIQHYVPFTKDLQIFLENLKVLIQPYTKFKDILTRRGHLKKIRPFAFFSTFYKSNDNLRFQFVFDLEENEGAYKNALLDVFKTIKIIQSETNALQLAIKTSFSQSNRIKYLLYIDKQWNVIDPLLEVVREINLKYRENKDFRINKPRIIMHRENFSKNFVFDKNWGLVFDRLETLMIKPNDIALYSDISDTNLKKAKSFYDSTIIPRHKQYSGSFPNLEKQREYYNYFELIISALIFAYTSLESLANICIPDSFEDLNEKDGTKKIYSKEDIERNFSLREKFKKILKSILNTPDPAKEKWWSSFIYLEKLRGEVIHTKQSKSEDRYSQLLSKRIFKTIEIHKEIIHYYGFYISENKRELLEDYPYEFGYDDFLPGLTDDKGYEQTYRFLHNIPDKPN